MTQTCYLTYELLFSICDIGRKQLSLQLDFTLTQNDQSSLTIPNLDLVIHECTKIWKWNTWSCINRKFSIHISKLAIRGTQEKALGMTWDDSGIDWFYRKAGILTDQTYPVTNRKQYIIGSSIRFLIPVVVSIIQRVSKGQIVGWEFVDPAQSL